MSSRRSKTRTDGTRRSALEELRCARQKQSTEASDSASRIATYQPKESSVYKVVTEEEYEDLVRQRRQGLPFVANDDAELGYYDDGEEQFFESDEEGNPSEQVEPSHDDSGASKQRIGALSSAYARRAKKLQRAKLGDGKDSKITSLLHSSSSMQMKTAKRLKTSETMQKTDLDLNSMLEDLTSNPTKAGSSFLSPPSFSSFKDNESTIRMDDDFSYHMAESMATITENDDSLAYEHDAASDNHLKCEVAEELGDHAMETTDDKPEEVKPPTKREVLLRKARARELLTTNPIARALSSEFDDKEEKPEEMKTIDIEPVGEIPSNEVMEWWQTSESCAHQDPVVEEDVKMEDPLEHGKTSSTSDRVRIFWMDAIEIRDRPGKLYLIGKVKVVSGSTITYQSCCITVNNLERCMYLVPKTEAVQALDPKATTMNDLTPELQQALWMKMHQDIHHYLIPNCITGRKDKENFKTKLVEREYAFEREDIPRGKNKYVKVRYSARYPITPPDICERGGRYFSRICGASTRPLEIFLLGRKLLGPGWIEVCNVHASQNKESFCQLEYATDNPKGIHVLHGEDSDVPPPLKVLSLSLKAVCHPTTHHHEIITLSMITETGVNCEGASMSQRRSISHFTTIRPVDATTGFPDTFPLFAQQNARFRDQKTTTENRMPSLRFESNERAMLSYFLTRIQLEDPDVIVGHNLHSYTLNLLLSRIDHYKLGGLWSKLTRLRRGRLQPVNVGEAWNEYRFDDISNGRLLCDTWVSSKELLPSQNNYSLTHLATTILKKQRFDIEMNEIPQIMCSSPQYFTKLLCHTLDDAMFILQLMHQLQILPLSKQLANLCGYLWPRTLEANKRAERIEFLLSHEFSKSKHKFILPEKVKQSRGSGGKQREKASYMGGMVFSPKKGLYDNFVVLLDFNSLYPSIIREYNICFTTVDRKLEENTTSTGKRGQKRMEGSTDVKSEENIDAEEDIPALPPASCGDGVLPGVIKRLLDSRKQVKQALVSASRAGQKDKAQSLDIRQKAIKLTANSMYGCLGFRYSRYYAKAIAALITSTGRQTLQRAKEVAELECGYDVIYGDTDSIMVDSRSDQLLDAKRIGREIQTQCNKHFELLELEVDSIFKTILLLNKKKYAALVVKETTDTSNSIIIRYEKEVKGLDLVRRDWCVISKVVGNDILDQILSGKARDEVVDNIHMYLETVATRIRSELDPIDQFVITKSLNKQPEQYPDGAKQYHVQVALALKQQGQHIGVGSHIPYVLCKVQDPRSGRYAYHPDEVKRAAGKLPIDYEWYLESQIHPPVNRLCTHIEGTSSIQLAQCLGLDTSKFKNLSSNIGTNPEDDENDSIPSVLRDDQERFSHCVPLHLTCKQCHQSSNFPGVLFASGDDNGAAKTMQSGLLCPQSNCRAEFWGYTEEGLYGNVGDDLAALLSNQLHLATRAAVRRYYEAWLVCSDVTCKTRTQKQSLRGNGNTCSASGCQSLVHAEYTEYDLYTQLKYFSALFDPVRAMKKLQEEEERALPTASKPDAKFILPERHQLLLQKMHNQAEKIVRLNEYNWVKPTLWQTLFT
uniref:DNA polymerase n=1 Tax=Albugo laibachii Nc14 TaxID=890382 RepID=F0W8W3_9STRA|nr:DNA polymerase alpha catalytic subunit putative [Albugo laibachii Nc14]|eukprot:CCA17574.1 DNA polymerase alpha catalytic subunit putative [Albugo laibachii Nc14]